MGTWGVATFEDDVACDWLYRLEEEPVLEVLANSLRAASGEDYLDRDIGMEALCACEALAVVLGVPSQNLPESLIEALGDVTPVDVAQFVPAALDVLTTLTGEASELNELWRENTDDYPRWLESIVDLHSRLSGSSPDGTVP